MNETQKENLGFWQEFSQFAFKSNVIELAIAVVVGGAFGKITSSLVNDLVMLLVNPLIPGGDWRNLVIGPNVRVGSFIGSLVDFLIITNSLFIVVRFAGRMKTDKTH